MKRIAFTQKEIRKICIIRRFFRRVRYHFWVQGIRLYSSDFLPKLINNPKSMPLAFK